MQHCGFRVPLFTKSLYELIKNGQKLFVVAGVRRRKIRWRRRVKMNSDSEDLKIRKTWKFDNFQNIKGHLNLPCNAISCETTSRVDQILIMHSLQYLPSPSTFGPGWRFPHTLTETFPGIFCVNQIYLRNFPEKFGRIGLLEFLRCLKIMSEATFGQFWRYFRIVAPSIYSYFWFSIFLSTASVFNSLWFFMIVTYKIKVLWGWKAVLALFIGFSRQDPITKRGKYSTSTWFPTDLRQFLRQTIN